MHTVRGLKWEARVHCYGGLMQVAKVLLDCNWSFRSRGDNDHSNVTSYLVVLKTSAGQWLIQLHSALFDSLLTVNGLLLLILKYSVLASHRLHNSEYSFLVPTKTSTELWYRRNCSISKKSSIVDICLKIAITPQILDFCKSNFILNERVWSYLWFAQL